MSINSQLYRFDWFYFLFGVTNFRVLSEKQKKHSTEKSTTAQKSRKIAACRCLHSNSKNLILLARGSECCVSALELKQNERKNNANCSKSTNYETHEVPGRSLRASESNAVARAPNEKRNIHIGRATLARTHTLSTMARTRFGSVYLNFRYSQSVFAFFPLPSALAHSFSFALAKPIPNRLDVRDKWGSRAARAHTQPKRETRIDPWQTDLALSWWILSTKWHSFRVLKHKLSDGTSMGTRFPRRIRCGRPNAGKNSIPNWQNTGNLFIFLVGHANKHADDEKKVERPIFAGFEIEKQRAYWINKLRLTNNTRRSNRRKKRTAAAFCCGRASCAPREIMEYLSKFAADFISFPLRPAHFLPPPSPHFSDAFICSKS